LQDISGSILVAVGKVATKGAHMRPDAQGFFDRLTARGALLRSGVRSHSNDLTPSTFSLGFKVVPEHPPRCIGYSKGQTMISNHVGWPQIFNGDDLIAIDIGTGSFVKGIFALVGNALMVTSYLVFGFLSALAPFLTFRQLALRSGQFLCALLGMFGVVDDLSVAIGHQVADPHIQPNSILASRQGGRLCLTDTLEIPARRTQDNAGTFERAFKGAMYNGTDTTAALSRSFEASIVQTILCITELDGMPGLRILEARKANVATFVEATKEVGEGAMKSFEGGIDDHRRQIRMSRFAMPLILLIEVHVRTRLFVVVDQLLKTGIVHLARGNQHAHQGVFLCLGWSKAILKGSHNSNITLSDYMVNKQGLKPRYALPLPFKRRGLRRAKTHICQRLRNPGSSHTGCTKCMSFRPRDVGLHPVGNAPSISFHHPFFLLDVLDQLEEGLYKPMRDLCKDPDPPST
jgi:hypothetical protein